MEAERQSPPVSGDRIGNERVARSAANAFAQAIGEPDTQHLRPRSGQREQGLGDVGETVAKDDQRFAAAEAIRQQAGKGAHHAGRALRNPFDQPDGRHRSPQDRGDKQRQHRHNHL